MDKRRLQLTKKERDLHCQGLWWKEFQRRSLEDFTCCLLTTSGSRSHWRLSGCAVRASHGRAIKPHNNECRERIRAIVERTLTGKARMHAHKDSVGRDRASERVAKSSSGVRCRGCARGAQA